MLEFLHGMHVASFCCDQIALAVWHSGSADIRMLRCMDYPTA